MAEFPDLGDQCFLCHTLDFLPVVCDYCKKTFCKLHLTATSHGCEGYVEKDNVLKECPEKHLHERCSFCNEQVKNPLELVVCAKCNVAHCLRHRHPESHECSGLKVENHRSPAIQIVLPVERPSMKVTGTKGAKNDALAKKVQLMKLKQSAVGLPSIPQSERLYFSLSLENKETPAVYLSSQWSTGKCVDFVADKFGIKNNNNKPDLPKLVLITETDERLPFEVKLKDLISQQLIETGQRLFLKYVDPL